MCLRSQLMRGCCRSEKVLLEDQIGHAGRIECVVKLLLIPNEIDQSRHELIERGIGTGVMFLRRGIDG